MAVLKDLIVHGPSHFIGASYINILEANKIRANEGIFTKLAAKNASVDETLTVNGLLDVYGELHTKSWSNSNIATVDGNLHIVPTITAATASGTITYSSSAYSMSITGAFATNTLTVGTSATIVAWTPGSKLIVSGEVLVNNEWLPLGTLKCDLGGSANLATDAASKTIPLTAIKDGTGNTSGVLEAIRTTLNLSGTSGTLQFRNVKIAFYSRKNTNMYPIGILLTAQGTGASKTFIDMYNGNNATSGTYGGLALPVVRIGNLSGSNLPKVGGYTPTGWGIYTNNGYFSGTIAAEKGKIANWTITSSSIQTGDFNTANTMYFGTSGISLGTTFRVTAGGVLTATSGTIGGYALTANYLQSTDGTSGLSVADNSTTASWAFWAGGTTTAAVKFRVDHNGILYAKGAHIDGEITASKLTISANAAITDNTGKISNDAIQIGGTNLMMQHNAVINSAAYAAYDIYLSEPLQSGQVYTLQLWDVTISHTGKTAANLGPDIYYCGGSVRFGGWHGTTYITNGHADHLQIIFTAYTSGATTCTGGNQSSTSDALGHSTVTSQDDKFIRIYNSVSNADGTRNLSIGAYKLEKGNKGTMWSPSPEDIQTTINDTVDVLDNRVTDIQEDITDTINQHTNAIGGLQSATSANTATISSQTAAISTLQTGQNTINTNISTIRTTTQNLNDRTATLEGAVVIDKTEPSVTVTSGSGAVKITSARVTIKGGGNSVAWSDAESFNAQKGVFTEIRPRTMSVSGSNVTLSGNLIFLARSNGHVSLKKLS